MNTIGKPERAARNRIRALFQERLGYAYLGDGSERAGNSIIDAGVPAASLSRAGYGPAAIRTWPLVQATASRLARGR